MHEPTPPQPKPIKRLSYSQYEAGLRCLARLAWSVSGDGASLPGAPGALLGQAFHAVLRSAHTGRLSNSGIAEREGARHAFDTEVATLWRGAHELLRLKFREPRRLPFYNVKREEAAALAARIAAASGPRAGALPPAMTQQRMHGSERWLESRDGRLVGRADYVDQAQRAVVDYKSGQVAGLDPLGVSPEEGRQLRFYAHLAEENGTAIQCGVIVRGDGRRTQVELSPADVASEGSNAREVLRCYNEAVGTGVGFHELAVASERACAGCACVPFCHAFWKGAEPAWSESCGIHVEGSVRECSTSHVFGARLVQLRIASLRGTYRAPGDVEVDQLPAEWFELGGDAVPSVGATVRVVHARSDENRPGVLRVDKASTAVWQV